MKPIVFHPDAGQEARDARDYYESLRFGLGDDFKVEVERALGRIQKNPGLFAVALRNIRRCSVRRFPYSLYFEEFDEQIWIAAVAHNSRRPRYWSKRRP